MSRALWPVASRGDHAAQPVAGHDEIHHLGLEAHLAAAFKDRRAHRLHHVRQQVRADVRMRVC
jgi:hypothetical protein